MPYSFRAEGNHRVAIFNKAKHKVVAHAEGATRDEAMHKAHRVARLREWYAKNKG
jgi:hypothetical protein